MTLPNALTIGRILLLPALVIAALLPGDLARYFAAGIFGLAALTDWLDGHLARRLRLDSSFGAFLDPVADKLLVATSLLVLMHNHPGIWLLLPAIVIIGREIVISALRQWMAEIQEHVGLRVSFIAKVKTALQMSAIFILLLHPARAGPWGVLVTGGYVLLYISAIMTLWSMAMYLRAAWPSLRVGIGGSSDTA